MLCQEFSFIISIWSSENTVLGLLSPDNKFFREISLFFKCTRKKNRVRAHVRVLECLCTRTPNFYKMRTRTQPYAKILSDAHAPARNSYEFFEVEWGGFENLSWNAGVGWGGDFTGVGVTRYKNLYRVQKIVPGTKNLYRVQKFVPGNSEK